MTLAIDGSTVAGTARAGRLWALVSLEARRTWRSPWIWAGLALAAIAARSTLDASFSGGAYQGTMASITGLATGTFLVAVVAGSRDRSLAAGPLAEAAVVDVDDRALARLLGLWPAMALSVAYVVGLGVYERVTGGFWLGNRPWRTDEATHSAVELLQGPSLSLLAACAGVAIGRVTARRAVACVLGTVVLTTLGALSWAWQWRPAVYVTLVQTQPVDVPLADRMDPESVPAGWLLSAPDVYDRDWDRLVVHEAMAAGHAAYLVGLALVAAALAIRGVRGRLLGAGGAVLAVASVVVQVVANPAGA